MTMSDSLFFFFRYLIIDSGQGDDEESLVDDRYHIPFPTPQNHPLRHFQ